MEPEASRSNFVEYPRPTEERKPPNRIIDVVLFCALVVLCLLFAPRSTSRGTSKAAKIQADLANFRGAIDQFRLDCDRYPTSLEGFEALRVAPKDAKNWNGPYLQKDPSLDTWRRPYVYQRTWANGKSGYIVESYGADGKPGGTGEDADIVDGSD